MFICRDIFKISFCIFYNLTAQLFLTGCISFNTRDRLVKIKIIFVNHGFLAQSFYINGLLSLLLATQYREIYISKTFCKYKDISTRISGEMELIRLKDCFVFGPASGKIIHLA